MAMRASNVLVRPGHDEDLPRVLELLRVCVEHMRAVGIDQWDDVYPSEATLRADLANRALYVASAPGHPVAGVFVIDERQEPEYAAVAWKISGRRVGVVHRLMVHPACQRRGLGRFLMRFAELRARGLGYDAIRLDAFTGNAPSLGLYQGLGYQDAGGVRFRKGDFRCFEKGLAS
jgi:ribosomal protein S18 acetylase RimI-like enzyme